MLLQAGQSFTLRQLVEIVSLVASFKWTSIKIYRAGQQPSALMFVNVILTLIIQFRQQSIVREGNIANPLNESFARNAGYVVFVF